MSGDEVEEVVRGLSAEERAGLLRMELPHDAMTRMIKAGVVFWQPALASSGGEFGITPLGRQVAERLSRA